MQPDPNEHLSPVDAETNQLVDDVLNNPALDPTTGAEPVATVVEVAQAPPAPAVEEPPVTVQPAAPAAPAAFDFAKVEALRKHMMLTGDNMADLIGVSRITYYNWVKGGQVRKTNAGKLRAVLQKLLKLMQAGWPQHEVIIMKGKDRYAALLELMKDPA